MTGAPRALAARKARRAGICCLSGHPYTTGQQIFRISPTGWCCVPCWRDRYEATKTITEEN